MASLRFFPGIGKPKKLPVIFYLPPDLGNLATVVIHEIYKDDCVLTLNLRPDHSARTGADRTVVTVGRIMGK